MKKSTTYMQRFLIIFIVIAYVLPSLCFQIKSLAHILSTDQTVKTKESKEKNSISLLANNNKEPLNKDNVEKFADGLFNEQIKKFNVPGAVFAVVKDNTVLFEKGYGYSDIDKKIPVDPKTTVFRVASISKLFTATAVMQLKEKGKVNLKEDVNKYLKDFKIENKYSKPVTLENLLTHTAGFDERIIGESVTKSYLQEKPLKDNLISRLRPLIREPGEAPQYSNYGMSVAGYVVESMTGTPFNKYMEDNILKPLHMNNSSFSFNKKIRDNLSKGYDYKNGIYKKVPVYGSTFAPVGGLKTTADDMTKFMMAHLNHGTYDNTTILNKDTTEDMHKKHFPLDINIPGLCYGFEENNINGVRVLAHGGNDYGFNSLLYLIPDSNLGFFISTNGDNGANIFGSIIPEFMNKYYPQSKVQSNMNNKVKFTKSNLKKLEGVYQASRYPRNEIGKLVKLAPLLVPTLNIKSKSDALIVKYPGGQDLYKEIEPLLFKNVERGDTIAFKANKQGNISYMFYPGSPIAYGKIHWYENPMLHKIIFVLFSILFLGLFIAMLLINLRKKANKEPLLFKYHRWILPSICILNLVFLLGMAKECMVLSSSLTFLPELPKMMIYLLVIPIITTIITLALMISTLIYWNKEKSNSGILVRNILICCVFLIFSLFLNYWNLLGFKF
ncbi:beta-lactamase family protein [Clostridium tagluense]|uniref:serine hydrolase domain-containing protein n=1 Tax=Clostridium tagluense TaxID=360422 RepID=UPI001CF2B671|nr:serine hydrolase domain-containing protein [Clostridium tagluense]MCB2310442.1 beta-lactamase family protein [Clostridium tagluense]MCB2315392.1 beta-lactamase family protein [Clostridium tagluense]MCB2320243.1 beta-lactamase family protein [Clostridium tagluense]MCB2325134.1 beta-lactamase family protein [Clostridium tagluense]MCB2329986.1 beta-lactamase family protein [Clostridium tagluense]